MMGKSETGTSSALLAGEAAAQAEGRGGGSDMQKMLKIVHSVGACMSWLIWACGGWLVTR
jgi:hypothetical protein